jgi:uncharacterized protein YigA (DUF484 family)
MEDRIRNIEDFTQYATEMIILMEEDRRAMREAIRRLEESVRRLDENADRRDELMQRILQTVAVIQADIVRIDETRS